MAGRYKQYCRSRRDWPKAKLSVRAGQDILKFLQDGILKENNLHYTLLKWLIPVRLYCLKSNANFGGSDG